MAKRGRPRKYATEAERRAARLETYKRYNAKRTSSKPLVSQSILRPEGITMKETPTRVMYFKDGKQISANKVKRIYEEAGLDISSIKAAQRQEIKESVKDRHSWMKKKLYASGKSEFDIIREGIKEARAIHANRLEGAKLAVERLIGGSTFTEEQQAILKDIAQNFSFVAPSSDSVNFWEYYNEISKQGHELYGEGSFHRVQSTLDKENLRKMYEAQLGEAYTRRNLDFLY